MPQTDLSVTVKALAFVREAYVNGNCHFLAREISRKTGWPVTTCLNSEGEHAYHAFVLTPEGLGLDIDGLHTVEELAQQWGGATVNKQAHSVVTGNHDDEFDSWGSAEDLEYDDPNDIDYSEIWLAAEETASLVIMHYLPDAFPNAEDL